MHANAVFYAYTDASEMLGPSFALVNIYTTIEVNIMLSVFRRIATYGSMVIQ